MSTTDFQGRVVGPSIDAPVLAASIALNILALTMPLVILLIFDRVIPFQSTDTLTMLTLGLVIAAVLEFILRWCRSVLLSAAAEQAAISNHRLFLRKVLNAKTVAFANESSAVHLERYSALGRLRDHYAGSNQTLAIDLPFTAVFVVMVGLIGGWLVLVPLGGLLAVLVFSYVMKRAQWSLFDTRKTQDARRYTFLSEVLSNMVTVKANTMERQMTRRYELLAGQSADSSHKLISFSGFSQSYGAVFAQLSVAAMGLFGAYLVILGQIGIAELAACMLLNGRVIQPLMKLMTLWVQSEAITVSKAKLEEMNGIAANRSWDAPAQPLSGLVELSRVTMAHPNGAGNAFENATFRVAPGTTALVEAQDGWAAAAFFEGVIGQREPDAGSILIDGYLSVDRIAQRGKNGIVALENAPAMLSGSLLENLSAFGDAEQVEHAKAFAAQLGLERRIHRLPQGYHTQLSTGTVFEKDPINRQLIALVRALCLRPRLLLMNEPTAILETPEREALSTCLASLSPKPTILIASPDPRMKRLASETLSLTLGRDAEIDAWLADAAQDQISARILKKGAA